MLSDVPRFSGISATLKIVTLENGGAFPVGMTGPSNSSSASCSRPARRENRRLTALATSTSDLYPRSCSISAQACCRVERICTSNCTPVCVLYSTNCDRYSDGRRDCLSRGAPHSHQQQLRPASGRDWLVRPPRAWHIPSSLDLGTDNQPSPRVSAVHGGPGDWASKRRSSPRQRLARWGGRHRACRGTE
jgi:hypothetical protein